MFDVYLEDVICILNVSIISAITIKFYFIGYSNFTKAILDYIRVILDMNKYFNDPSSTKRLQILIKF